MSLVLVNLPVAADHGHVGYISSHAYVWKIKHIALTYRSYSNQDVFVLPLHDYNALWVTLIICFYRPNNIV